jgi:hypothetical protein
VSVRARPRFRARVGPGRAWSGVCAGTIDGDHTLSRSADGRSATAACVPSWAIAALADVCGPRRTEVNETKTETSEDHPPRVSRCVRATPWSRTRIVDHRWRSPLLVLLVAPQVRCQAPAALESEWKGTGPSSSMTSGLPREWARSSGRVPWGAQGGACP